MIDEQQTYKNRITINPAIMIGKPVVKGTRIPVERVVAHLAHNPDLNDLFAAYPELTVEDVKACLQYAHRLLRSQENGQVNILRKIRKTLDLKRGDLVAVMERPEGTLITLLATKTLDRIGDILKGQGLSLEKMLVSGRQIRTAIL
jgi:uncharacterized protein (DUF433 family)